MKENQGSKEVNLEATECTNSPVDCRWRGYTIHLQAHLDMCSLSNGRCRFCGEIVAPCLKEAHAFDSRRSRGARQQKTIVESDESCFTSPIKARKVQWHLTADRGHSKSWILNLVKLDSYS